MYEGIVGFFLERVIFMEYFEVFGKMFVEDGFILKYFGYNVFNKDMDVMWKFILFCFNIIIYEYFNGKFVLF